MVVWVGMDKGVSELEAGRVAPSPIGKIKGTGKHGALDAETMISCGWSCFTWQSKEFDLHALRSVAPPLRLAHTAADLNPRFTMAQSRGHACLRDRRSRGDHTRPVRD
jgi:hypothetical protein